MNGKLAFGVTSGLIALGSYGIAGYSLYQSTHMPELATLSARALKESERIINDDFVGDPVSASKRSLELLTNLDSRMHSNEHLFILKNLTEVASGVQEVKEPLRPVIRDQLKNKLEECRAYALLQRSELQKKYIKTFFHSFIWGGGLGSGFAFASIRDYLSNRKK